MTEHFLLLFFLAIREAWLGTLCTLEQRKPSGQVSYQVPAVLMYNSYRTTWHVFNLIGVNYMHAGTCSTHRNSRTLLQTAPGSYLDGSASVVVSCTAWVGYWWPCRLPEVSACRQTSIEFNFAGMLEVFVACWRKTFSVRNAWAIAGDNRRATRGWHIKIRLN